MTRPGPIAEPAEVARVAQVAVQRAPLRGDRGQWARYPDGDVITLDPCLDERAARATLAHELVHSARGIGWGAASAATMAKEEALVEHAAAAWLAPPAAVAAALAEAMARVGFEPVTAAELIGVIADELGVDHDLAARALDTWAGVGRGSRASRPNMAR